MECAAEFCGGSPRTFCVLEQPKVVMSLSGNPSRKFSDFDFKVPAPPDPNSLPFFNRIPLDVLVNVFSRLEDDPRHLARLACVCRRFHNVARDVLWKRQCMRIVPSVVAELMQSCKTPSGDSDEPPGGWGSLMKVLVCCPGLKHAGVLLDCWDFGLERELGLSEDYACALGRNRKKIRRFLPRSGAAGSVVVRDCRIGNGNASCSSRTETVWDFMKRGHLIAGSPSGVRIVPNLAIQNSKTCTRADGLGEFHPVSVEGEPGLDEKVKECCSPEIQCESLEAKKSCRTFPVSKTTNGITIGNGKNSLGERDGKDDKVLVQDVHDVKVGEDKGNLNKTNVRVTEVSLGSSVDRGALLKELRPEKCTSLKKWDKRLRPCNFLQEPAVAKLELIISPLLESQLKSDAPHLASGVWSLSREQGCKLLASRFRADSLFICDWPGCVHPGERRNYKLFGGIFKTFKSTHVWRNLKDLKAKPTEFDCAFCHSVSTWDMVTTFCLRRSLEYHDDGEPVVRAYVCENGHVAGAWTDRPMYSL